jgi:hypothetical protein
MSPQIKRTVSDVMLWVFRGGSLLALYFLMDIHSDIKAMSEKVNRMDTKVEIHGYQLSIQESQIKDIQRKLNTLD